MKNYVKKAFCVALVLALVCTSLVGCGSSGSTDAAGSGGSGDVLARIVKDGEFKVAISLGNKPWCWKDDDGQIKGFAVDLVNLYAESIGIKTELVTLEFSGLIPAIQAGKADMIATNLTRKASRATTILYTDGVGSSYGVAIVKKDRFNSIEELNSESITTTTETGSIYVDVGKEAFPLATMSPTGNNSDALAAVKAGRADAMVTDLTIATAACAADSSIEFLTPYIYTDTFGFAAACSSDAYTFVESFNTFLRVIKADGTYAELYKAYFENDWVPTFTDAAI